MVDNYLLIQFENATCSSSLTECVVPSAEVFDVPPIVLKPGAALTSCATFEPKSLSCISSVYNCPKQNLNSLADSSYHTTSHHTTQHNTTQHNTGASMQK